MSSTPTTCSECGSDVIAFIEKTGQWLCTECRHRWSVDGDGVTSHDEETKPKLFLSYGRRDACELADRLSGDLTAKGYEVWRDTTEIRAGNSWEAQIEDGLRSTQLLIALLSPHAVRKSADPNNPDNLDSVCLDEISFARFARPPIPIVPAMASRCDPPFCIFRLDYVDLTSWSRSEDQYRDGLQRLLDAIEAARRNETRYRSWMHRLKPLDVFDAYLNEKRQDFCGREWLFDAIDAWRLSSRERALLIMGDPGVGKSAIVAQLVHLNPGAQLLAYHCCMADTPETLKPARFVQSLAAMIGSRLPEYAAMLETVELQEELSDARCNKDPASAFESGVLARLEELPAPDVGVRYIMIDALDEALTLRDGDKTIIDLLSSRMNRLPGWLRIVATTRKEPEVLRKLSALRAETIDAGDSRNLEDIANFISARLKTPNLAARLVAVRVTLEEVQRRLQAAGEGNFLYVKQALIDIERDNYQLDRLENLPQGLTGLYEAFFARQFGGTPDSEAYGPMRRVLEVAVAAEQPLEASQLALATGLDPEYELPQVLSRLATFLPQRDGCHSLYHKSLADWLTQPDNPYRASPKRGHAQLAEMCWRQYESDVDAMSRYALAFIPEHLIAAQQWDQLETVMTDLLYIEAKCTQGMTFDLVRDYANALESLPERGTEREQERQRQDSLRKYGQALIKYAQEHEQGCLLPEPPDTATDQKAMRRAERASQTDGGLMDGERRDVRIQRYASFVSTHGHILQSHAHLTIVQARSHASGGAIVRHAERILSTRREPWISRDPRPPAPPITPACIRTLEGHTHAVNCVAITPDGKIALSASDDKTVRVWDVRTGTCIRTLQRHTGNVTAVAISPDGKIALSAGWDETVRVWDVQTGTCIRTLQGHSELVSGVAITADGKNAISASHDRTVHVWGVTPDGKNAFSASDDKTVRIWDVQTGACIRTLEGHTSYVWAVAITPDGKNALSASHDKTMRIWDLKTGTSIAAYPFESPGLSVAVISNNRFLAGTQGGQLHFLTLRNWP